MALFAATEAFQGSNLRMTTFCTAYFTRQEEYGVELRCVQKMVGTPLLISAAAISTNAAKKSTYIEASSASEENEVHKIALYTLKCNDLFQYHSRFASTHSPAHAVPMLFIIRTSHPER